MAQQASVSEVIANLRAVAKVLSRHGSEELKAAADCLDLVTANLQALVSDTNDLVGVANGSDVDLRMVEDSLALLGSFRHIKDGSKRQSLIYLAKKMRIAESHPG